MKKLISLLIAIAFIFSAKADEEKLVNYERQQSAHIQEILLAWNQDKGLWLYESINSLVMMEPHPERERGFQKTVFEYLSEMSDHRKERLINSANVSLEREREETQSEDLYWTRWIEIIELTVCEVRHGRSNGDPHMQTFDGEKYDFQTAGEYMLTESTVNNFYIQTRQVKHNDNISVNAAMAVNVNGDIVTVYAQGFPDDQKDKPIRVNGQIVENDKEPIFLPEGGVIRYANMRHVIHSPTGEQVQFSTRKFQGSALLDIDIFIPSCTATQQGLLGNADGNPETDLVVRDENGQTRTPGVVDRTFANIFGAGRNNQNQRNEEVQRLSFLARDFGNQFLVDEDQSMFEAPIGILPEDLRYPSSHLTLSDLTDEEVEEALDACRKAGVAEEDLMECAFDYGYVGLDPVLPPVYIAPEESREIGLPDVNQTPNQGNDNTNIRRGVGIGTTILRGMGNRPTGTRTPTPTRTPTGGGVRTPR